MPKKDTVIDYEKVLQHVGPLGLWQFLNLCVLFSVTLCGGIAVVTFAFAGKEIEIIHRLFLVITMEHCVNTVRRKCEYGVLFITNARGIFKSRVEDE